MTPTEILADLDVLEGRAFIVYLQSTAGEDEDRARLVWRAACDALRAARRALGVRVDEIPGPRDPLALAEAMMRAAMRGVPVMRDVRVVCHNSILDPK